MTEKSDKASLRRRFRAARAALDPASRALASDRLVAWLESTLANPASEVVALTQSSAYEVPTGDAADWLLRAGATVAWFPVERDASPDVESLECESSAGRSRVRVVDVTLFLVPGVAFCADGRRLGQGGGYFDRLLLRRSPNTRVVGVGFECQRADSLPTEPHDVAMDEVLFL